MYRALYRKWRPMTFSDVIGQVDIVSALQNQIANKKSGHAYIFTGTRGTGKTTCAKIFAKAVNCLHTTAGNPCGVCDICKGVEDGSLVDVVEIDAASNNGVDSIRDLRDATVYTPSIATFKVYIIDEVHMLSTAAFNALLKIMEEPPSHIVFILATTEIHKVPATILSRCQRYDFMRIRPEDICERLMKIAAEEGINLSTEAASLISNLADGAMRDALSILDTCAGVTGDVNIETVQKMAGVTDKGYLFNFSQAVAKQDAVAAITLLAEVRNGCADTKRIVEELISHYRNLLLSGFDTNESLINANEIDHKKYVEAAKSIDKTACIFAIKRFGDCLERIGKGGDGRIELELAFVDLCYPAMQKETVYIAAPQTANSSPTPSMAAAQPHSLTPSSPMQQAVTQDVTPQGGSTLPPLAVWADIVEQLKSSDRALHSFLKKSRAFISGKRILIDAGPLFTSYIKQTDSAKDLIKKCIAEATGIDYAIGPYTPPENVQPTTQNANIEMLKNMGVEVIEE